MGVAHRAQDDDVRTMGWAIAHGFDTDWLLRTPLGEIARHIAVATPYESVDIPAHVLRTFARMETGRLSGHADEGSTTTP